MLIVAVLALAATAYWSFAVARPTWTATAALTTQSQNRAPEQDAVLSLGYVDYFNQATYQQSLRAEARIPDGVVLTAKTGAASPIIYIEAAGPSESAARTAAETAAETFRDDIRESLVDERALEVRDLQAQVNDAVRLLQVPGTTDAEGNVILDQIRSLQGRITDISSDATNHLKKLQPTAGAASTTRSRAVDLIAGGIGGVLLGLVVALVLALLDRRIRRADDVGRLGLATLAEFRRRQSPAERHLALERLANALSMTGGKRPTIVAVVGVGSGAAATRFARGLAGAASARRSGVMLVRADLRGEASGGSRGFAEFLTGGVQLAGLARREADGVRLVPAGDLAGRDPFSAVDPDRMSEFAEQARRTCGFVVVLASPLTIAPESQVICAAVDQVVLVAERGATRAAALKQAHALLESVGVTAAGVVLDDPGGAEEKPRPGEPPSVDGLPDASGLGSRSDVDSQTVAIPVTPHGIGREPAADDAADPAAAPGRQLVWKVGAGTSPMSIAPSLPSDGNGRRTDST